MSEIKTAKPRMASPLDTAGMASVFTMYEANIKLKSSLLVVNLYRDKQTVHNDKNQIKYQ